MGLDFNTAIKNCKTGQKIIFGTRSERYHIIDGTDRDFNTKFCATKQDAISLGAMGTKNLIGL